MCQSISVLNDKELTTSSSSSSAIVFKFFTLESRRALCSLIYSFGNSNSLELFNLTEPRDMRESVVMALVKPYFLRFCFFES